jgi:hypothetical protein
VNDIYGVPLLEDMTNPIILSDDSFIDRDRDPCLSRVDFDHSQQVSDRHARIDLPAPTIDGD